MIGPVAFNLRNNFTLLLVPEIDVLKDSADNSRHANYVLDVNLSREVIKNVTAYVELWSDYDAEPAKKDYSTELRRRGRVDFPSQFTTRRRSKFWTEQGNTGDLGLCGSLPVIFLIDNTPPQKSRV